MPLGFVSAALSSFLMHLRTKRIVQVTDLGAEAAILGKRLAVQNTVRKQTDRFRPAADRSGRHPTF